MDSFGNHEFSLAFQRWRAGQAGACEEVWRQAYDELKGIARRLLRTEPAGTSAQPTMLVHEAWRKLGGGGDPPPEGRRHFFFAAGRAMRDVLVERARTRLRQKRGGDRKRVDISTIEVAATAEPDGLLEVELAMEKLTAFNPRLARVVELRFFAGFTAEEAAEALEISLSTLEREWRMARAFLFRELSKGRRTEPDGGGPEISEGPKP